MWTFTSNPLNQIDWNNLHYTQLAQLPIDVYVYASIVLLSLTVFGVVSYRSKTTPPVEPKEEKPIEDDYVVVLDDSDDDEPKPVQLKGKQKEKEPEKDHDAYEVKHPYDAYLVIDVEATCQLGSSFDYPNEIIEVPVVLLTWTSTSADGQSFLRVMDEFKTFVRPTWKPTLSDFCKELTGISQEQVDDAPTFPEIFPKLVRFMARNGLVNPKTGERLVKFCWCSDGPFDVRDFIVKQCFISKVDMPEWLQGDVVDIRRTFMEWRWFTETHPHLSVKVLSIPRQLGALGLEKFNGRRHSGIDDARNLARVLIELAKRGVMLKPNTVVRPNKRWRWMGKERGQILGDEIIS